MCEYLKKSEVFVDNFLNFFFQKIEFLTFLSVKLAIKQYFSYFSFCFLLLLAVRRRQQVHCLQLRVSSFSDETTR